MLSVENAEVFGFEAALRGMRNPMNSWYMSDSDKHTYALCKDGYGYAEAEGIPMDCEHCDCVVWDTIPVIGEKDLDLCQRLIKAGTEHRKFLRMIHVQMDIVAPLYWWKEFDTYKVGTVSNSCSTMHKIHDRAFHIRDFSHEHLSESSLNFLQGIVYRLNKCRRGYLATGNKEWWWQMIQILPSSYNQRRTIDMTYENILTIIKQRSGHKLDEWNTLIEEFKKLPYVLEFASHA